MFRETELQRYRRQIPIFGEGGQARLRAARVFIAGAGGLGCPVALYLAAAGVGHIRVADCDAVDRTNLNRQVLHWDQDVGRGKAQSAAEKLRAVNPDIEITALRATVDDATAAGLAGDADVIVDAMDNFTARYVLNRTALRAGIPLVHGAVSGFDGQVTTVVPGQTACLQCIFPEPPPDEAPPVVGVTAGIVGLLQANEVIKLLLGTGDLLAGRLAVWNGLCTVLETIPADRRSDCEACGRGSEGEHQEIRP